MGVIALSLGVVFLGGNRTVVTEVPEVKPVVAKEVEPPVEPPPPVKPVEVDPKPVVAVKPVEPKPPDPMPVVAKPVEPKPLVKPADPKPADPKPVSSGKPDVKKVTPRVPTAEELKQRIEKLEPRVAKAVAKDPSLGLYLPKYRGVLQKAKTDNDRTALSRDLDELEKAVEKALR